MIDTPNQFFLFSNKIKTARADNANGLTWASDTDNIAARRNTMKMLRKCNFIIAPSWRIFHTQFWRCIFMPKRAALYIRVSSEEQARHGLSLGEQRKNLMNYAQEHGYIVVGVYADGSLSFRLYP